MLQFGSYSLKQHVLKLHNADRSHIAWKYYYYLDASLLLSLDHAIDIFQ